jgi:hypothetical protein
MGVARMNDRPRWYFREFLPGDNVSDPDFTKALFSSEGDAPLARSLVREGIQNSLDARREDEPVVEVRIRLLEGDNAVRAPAARPFVGELWQHLASESHGLEDPPGESEPVRCLVFEDFGTHGLRGDPEHWRPDDIKRNPFFLFFRALGRSGKSDEARGRWGVGKFVFPMSSRAHVIWGLTVPSESRTPLLMGRAVLRTHTIGSSSYHPDGHWGVQLNESGKLVSAVRDAGEIGAFRTAFGIERNTTPGLSVVVPWLDSGVTLPGIRAAVLEEYFMPLLRGELIVTLVSGESREVLGPGAVHAYARTAATASIRRRLELAIAVAEGAAKHFTWPVTFAYDETEWKPNQASPEFLETVRSVLESGEPVTVALPVTVRPKEGKVVPGMLRVHLLASEGLGASRPLLIRDGISVTEEKTKTVHDFAVLLTTDRCPLATMIGDAETPAHERLQHELLKNRYVYPKKMLTFVRESASSLLRAIWARDEGDDPLALAAFFPVSEGAGKTQPKPKTSDKGPAPEPAPSPEVTGTPRRFTVQRVEGGFRLAGRLEADRVPDQLSVRVAYDVRRGDPFKKFRPFDFDFGSQEFKVSSAGCEVSIAAPNQFSIHPLGPGYEFTVTGFDVRRDIAVRVEAHGGRE